MANRLEEHKGGCNLLNFDQMANIPASVQAASLEEKKSDETLLKFALELAVALVEDEAVGSGLQFLRRGCRALLSCRPIVDEKMDPISIEQGTYTVRTSRAALVGGSVYTTGVTIPSKQK